MSNEKSNRGSRRSRRRIFRPAKEEAAAPPSAAPAQNHAAPPAQPRPRKTRRKSRSRQRSTETVRGQAVAEPEITYVPPQAVFIYTHSVHPEMRDSYEFRPEHFSKAGHRLETFQIDISTLFAANQVGTDNLPVVRGLAKPEYNWLGWEDESADKTE